MINIDPRDLPPIGTDLSLQLFLVVDHVLVVSERVVTPVSLGLIGWLGAVLKSKVVFKSKAARQSPALLLKIYLPEEFILLVQIINPLISSISCIQVLQEGNCPGASLVTTGLEVQEQLRKNS